MGVVITRDDIQAYAEVDYIIKHMNKKYQDKVPEKLKLFFSEFKDPTHVIKLDPYMSLAKQGLKRYTLEIIALIHLKYWCQDEERKKQLYSKMLDNQEKLNEQMKERFSTENLFDGKDHSKEVNESIQEDFSKPKPVQRYSEYTKNNTDIQDYTDVVGVKENNSKTLGMNDNIEGKQEKSEDEKSLIESSDTFSTFFVALCKKITHKIQKLFKKA